MQKKENDKLSEILRDKIDKLISKKEKENSALRALLNIDYKKNSKKKSK